MSTAHINAKPGAFAEKVVLPGDPLRAKFIAENYLENAELITDVRNVLGYTGTYNGEKVSVMAHGMGVPSVSIYVHELINIYGVKKLIRIGSAGAVSKDVRVRDVIVATSASCAGNTNRHRFGGFDYAAAPDFNLLKTCWEVSQEKNTGALFGQIFTSDLFYGGPEQMVSMCQKMGILGVEMESSALFAIAAEHRVQALSILTVSDHIVTGEETTAEERQTTFDNMMTLALETIIRD